MAVSVVVGLSVVAERVGPRTAGALAGLPTGTAISLFFIGLDNGASFASSSAIYNIIGLVAAQASLFGYYKASMSFRNHNIAMSALVSIIAYLLTICLLQFITPNALVAVVLSLASIVGVVYLFRKIEDSKITGRRSGAGVLLIRGMLAAAIILTVVESASLVGSKWAGLFSAFPTTTFPLMLIIHYTYGKGHVQTIIKNVPVGLSSLVAYSLTVSVAYPIAGIYFGTAAAYGVAFAVWLLIYLFYMRRGRMGCDLRQGAREHRGHV